MNYINTTYVQDQEAIIQGTGGGASLKQSTKEDAAYATAHSQNYSLVGGLCTANSGLVVTPEPMSGVVKDIRGGPVIGSTPV